MLPAGKSIVPSNFVADSFFRGANFLFDGFSFLSLDSGMLRPTVPLGGIGLRGPRQRDKGRKPLGRFSSLIPLDSLSYHSLPVVDVIDRLWLCIERRTLGHRFVNGHSNSRYVGESTYSCRRETKDFCSLSEGVQITPCSLFQNNSEDGRTLSRTQAYCTCSEYQSVVPM